MRFLPVWLAVAISAGVGLGLTLPAPPAALAAAVAAAFGLTLASFIRGDGTRVVCSALGGLTLGAWALASLDDGRARDPRLPPRHDCRRPSSSPASFRPIPCPKTMR